jgi:hypothetical protein
VRLPRARCLNEGSEPQVAILRLLSCRAVPFKDGARDADHGTLVTGPKTLDAGHLGCGSPRGSLSMSEVDGRNMPRPENRGSPKQDSDANFLENIRGSLCGNFRI